jgi:hypothetical protein
LRQRMTHGGCEECRQMLQEASWFRQDQGTQGTREPKGTQDPWQREIYQEIKWWCDDVICILMGMLTDFCVVFLM